TRSPTPSAVPCTRSTPASIAARQLMSPRPRSRCPCQSIFTSCRFTISCLTNFTSALTPSGVAWPTVSARQIRVAPQAIAAPYNALSASGVARVVSSVTYITGRPCFTADVGGARPYLLHDARARPRQPDVGGHDAQVRHEVEQPLFDVERGIVDGGGLQAVAQRLVIQVDAGPRPVEKRRAARLVPVVDQ